MDYLRECGRGRTDSDVNPTLEVWIVTAILACIAYFQVCYLVGGGQ